MVFSMLADGVNFIVEEKMPVFNMTMAELFIPGWVWRVDLTSTEARVRVFLLIAFLSVVWLMMRNWDSFLETAEKPPTPTKTPRKMTTRSQSRERTQAQTATS